MLEIRMELFTSLQPKVEPKSGLIQSWSRDKSRHSLPRFKLEDPLMSWTDPRALVSAQRISHSHSLDFSLASEENCCQLATPSRREVVMGATLETWAQPWESRCSAGALKALTIWLTGSPLTRDTTTCTNPLPSHLYPWMEPPQLGVLIALFSLDWARMGSLRSGSSRSMRIMLRATDWFWQALRSMEDQPTQRCGNSETWVDVDLILSWSQGKTIKNLSLWINISNIKN